MEDLTRDRAALARGAYDGNRFGAKDRVERMAHAGADSFTNGWRIDGVRTPRRRILFFALALAVCAGVPGCGEKGDPVKASLDRIVQAAHARDARAFMDNVAADFSAAQGMTRAEALQTLKQYFAAYAILDVTLRDLTIERAENAARARFTAQLEGQPQKFGGLDAILPRSSAWKFEVRLVPGRLPLENRVGFLGAR